MLSINPYQQPQQEHRKGLHGFYMKDIHNSSHNFIFLMISQVLREFLNRPYEFYLDADIPTVFRMTDSDIPNLFRKHSNQLIHIVPGCNIYHDIPHQTADEHCFYQVFGGGHRLENGRDDGWRVWGGDFADEQGDETKAERFREKEPGDTVPDC